MPSTFPQTIQTEVKDARKTLEQLWREVGTETRTQTGNIVAIVAPDNLELIEGALLELPRRVASRQIIGVLDDCDCVTLRVALLEVHGQWLERFILSGNADQLQGAILPLLAGEVLTTLWWTRVTELPPRGKVFQTLSEVADQVIADTLSVRLDEKAPYALADIAWSRTAPWRELTCQLFDEDGLLEHLSKLERVTISYAQGRRGDQAARFYGAWLVSKLGWGGLSQVTLEGVKNEIVQPGEICAVDLFTDTDSFRLEAEEFGLAQLEVKVPGGWRVGRVPFPQRSLTWQLTFAMDAPEHNALYEAALTLARDSLMSVQKFDTSEALGKVAADLFVLELKKAVLERGVFHVALSGGSTPVHLYAALRDRNLEWAALPWDKVRWYWSDERCVDPSSSESNYRLAWDKLLSGIGVNPAQVFRIEGELEPELAARRYAEILPERLDLCYLGMGDDGHTASLFPDTNGLKATGRVTANFVPKLEAQRITLSFAEINRSRKVHILATGEKKATVLLEVKNKSGKYPVERVERPLWLLDEAAARLL
ncbi:MAG: 6-phosphogluconolactonase [Pseudopedobacter sp.]|nr:6-phosphogluconolactonase [Deinococcales bacterium]